MIVVFLCLILVVVTDSSESGCAGVVFTKKRGNFAFAQSYCKSLGLNIVRIHNEDQNRWIYDIAFKNNIVRYWIDGNNNKNKHTWLDSDNKKLKYTKWGIGEPNNWEGKENCIELFPGNSNTWNDVDCNFINEIVCSQKHNIGICKEQFENQYYGAIITNSNGDFATAQRYCKSLGQNIIRIDNDRQNSWIYNIARRKKIMSYWLDGNDIKTEGIWLNSDKKRISYTKWSLGKPDNYGGIENCMEVINDHREVWNDVYCNALNSIICTSNKPTCKISPDVGFCKINNINSGSGSQRTVSWEYTGAKTSIYYRVEYQVKYTDEIFIKLTNVESISLNNLEKNLVYQVKVRAEKRGNVNGINEEGEFSKTVEFFTGRVNMKVSNAISVLDSTKKRLHVFWSLDDPSSISMHTFMVRVNNTKGICLGSITFVFVPYNDIRKQAIVSQQFVNKWNQLSKCIQSTKKNFAINTEYFGGMIYSSKVLSNFTLTIYGLNVLGIHKLFEKIIK